MMQAGWSTSDTTASLQGIYLIHAFMITLVGTAMNVFVIYRMRRLYNRNPEQYRNGIGICLFVMSVADLISLGSLMAHFTTANMSAIIPTSMMKILCPLISFVAHTAYTQSMWCWWLMSALRFLATRRPLQYTTLWRLPCMVMGVTFMLVSFFNSFLMATVHYDPKSQMCYQDYTATARTHRMADVFLSFFTPTILVLYMDLSVLCCRIQSRLADPMLQIVINRPAAEKRKSLHRFLVITGSCILLNFPENFLRFGIAAGLPFVQPAVFPAALAVLTKALYFAQFAFKSFYLTTFVYDRSVLSKTNSSRQLSISFRQRLEESQHLIRERSSTISYRATTPIPTLARNSSCNALNELIPDRVLV
ncbi:unnamed protein product [Bursaphelenchus xylophilus]|uniref:(pine wood nematode) hypothetical protein n=1 Tax=Bursaphelenchus xylophilus TaxID=6326 RepID=A0A1I7SUK5_BURXY|nr:unnamed protein product [Bursaphelenchus xylophilus]CAG9118627.1 unnamed protein product [Bursaphelenchus xylophilus]